MEDPSALCAEALNCYQTEPAKAVALFSRAADLGSPEGCFGLAEMKLTGQGTQQDIEGAIELYTRSAENGKDRKSVV